MTTTIATVKLTAYNMGDDATEKDFDAWVAYVSEELPERCGCRVDVDAFPFRGGPADDRIVAGDEDLQDFLAEELRYLWADWCAEGAPRAAASPAPLWVLGLVGGDAANAEDATWLDLDRGNAPEEWAALVAEDKIARFLERSGATEVSREPWDGAPFGDGASGLYTPEAAG